MLAVGHVAPQAELHHQEQEQAETQQRVGHAARGLDREAREGEEGGQRGNARHRDPFTRVGEEFGKHGVPLCPSGIRTRDVPARDYNERS